MELIGAINTEDSMSSLGKDFKLLFYKQPKYIRSVKGSRKCPFFVEPYYEDLSAKELQDILNQKLIDENATFRTAMTVYEAPLGDLRTVLCHLLVFERRGNLEDSMCGNDSVSTPPVYMVLSCDKTSPDDIKEYLY